MATRHLIAMRCAHAIRRRRFAAAAVVGETATLGIDAALRDRPRRRQAARNRIEPLAVLAAPRRGQAAQQAHRVRMTRPREDIFGRAFLDQLARVKHADALTHASDHGKVMADEQHGRAQLRTQLRDEIEHFGFDSGVEPRGRFVENQQRRVGSERHRDHHALLHAARQLMRIAGHHPLGRRTAHPLQHLERALQCFFARETGGFECFGHLPRNRERRIQRAAGVLIDHRNRIGAQRPQCIGVELVHLRARDRDLARLHFAVARQIAQRRHRDGRLAAARFADEPIRLAAPHAKRHVLQHFAIASAHPVRDRQADDGQRIRAIALRDVEGGERGGRRSVHRSSTPCTPSAIRFTPTTSDAIAAAANTTVHHAPPAISVYDSERARPQSADGG